MRGTCCGSESNFSIQVKTIALFVPGSVIPLKCRDGPSCHEEESCRKGEDCLNYRIKICRVDVICLNLQPTSFLSTCCFETSNAII